MNKNELLAVKKWLIEEVLANTPRAGDRMDKEHHRRTLMHIDDIDWRLETDPPREACMCGADLPFRLHKAECNKTTPCYPKKECRALVREYLSRK